ncbi:MAG: hypothetical protein WC942_07085 [Clostridia bacterium]|jgi:hypothetical protein
MKQLSLSIYTKWLHELDKEVQFVSGVSLSDLNTEKERLWGMFSTGLSVEWVARKLSSEITL